MTDVAIGLDIGTSSTKAVAVSADGAVQAEVRREHGVAFPGPGRVEQDAESIWWEQSCEILSELTAELATGSHRPCALAVSGLGPCVLACDADMQPLHAAILYGIDTRSDPEIDDLVAQFGSEDMLRRGGSSLTSQAGGPKLLWLRRHAHEVWEQMAGFYSASSFLVGRLTGEYVLDHHTASQYNPFYDLDGACWALDWIEEAAPGLELPRLVWSDEVCGEVQAGAAAATGLPAGLPVLGGTVDAWAEAHSVGVRAVGDLLLAYGSTMFLITPAPPGPANPGLWRTAGLRPESQSLAAGMATSGLLTGWLSDLTGQSVAELSEAAAGVPAGASGLLVLPYFAGERSPLFDPGARGVVAGLRLDHGSPQLMRAVYEATAMSVRHVLTRFAAAASAGEPGDGPAWRVVAAGGGTKSATWMQIVSDVTGQAQTVPSQTIGASYGDALLAAEASGLVPPGTDWTRIAEAVEPNPELSGVYDTLFSAYLELYPATRDVVGRLR